MPARRAGHLRRWLAWLIPMALVAVVLLFTWQALLRGAGWALVASDPMRTADVIIVSVDAGAAGVLEAADLAHAGIARRVMIFDGVRSPAARELLRRGVPVRDSATVAIEELGALGITAQAMPQRVSGTEQEADVIPAWCEREHVRTVVFVSSRDHSRRTRHLLRRALRDLPVQLIERPARYSSFDPDSWWRSRNGVRIELTESQKLVIELLQHPFS